MCNFLNYLKNSCKFDTGFQRILCYIYHKKAFFFCPRLCLYYAFSFYEVTSSCDLADSFLSFSTSQQPFKIRE